MIGLNVGSGQRPFTSTLEVRWINVDSQEKWKPDIVCDGRSVPLKSESTDYVVLHHVLEHFGCGEGADLINEAYRVLRPGGSLLVFVPDMMALAKRFVNNELDTQIYMTNLYGAYMGQEEDRHRWGYTLHSLQSFLMNSTPWQHTRYWDNRRLPGADIAWDWWILGMEAIK